MKDIKKLVKDYLEENHAWKKKDDGNYHFEIDVDYRDEIEDSIAQEILESDSPRDTLLEKLWDWYQESEWDIIDNLVDDFKEKADPKLLEDANIIEDGNIDDDMIRDIFQDTVYIDYPEDWALSQEFCFNIIVSNGDDNYDFWLNEHIVDEDGKVDENAEKAGLVWLAKQQGYTLEEVIEALNCNGTIHQMKPFLSSINNEVYNGYGCEALTFCVKMTLGQAINLKEKMKSNQNGSIVIDKRVTCGLFNPWDGAGSILDISCEKDVEIPFENIWKFYIDKKRSRNYDSIHNVYGTDSSLWRDFLKEIKA